MDAGGNGNVAECLVINHACKMELIVDSEEKVDAEALSSAALPKLLCFSRCSAIIMFQSLNVIGRVALGKDINQEAAENLTGTEGKRTKGTERTKERERIYRERE